MEGEIKKGLSTSFKNHIWSNYVMLFCVCVIWSPNMVCSGCSALLFIKHQGNEIVTDYMYAEWLAAFGRWD